MFLLVGMLVLCWWNCGELLGGRSHCQAEACGRKSEDGIEERLNEDSLVCWIEAHIRALVRRLDDIFTGVLYAILDP